MSPGQSWSKQVASLDAKMMKRKCGPAASVAVLSFSRLPSKDPVGVLSLDWAHLPTMGLDNRDGLQGYRQPICGRGCDSSGMTVALAVSRNWRAVNPDTPECPLPPRSFLQKGSTFGEREGLQ